MVTTTSEVEVVVSEPKRVGAQRRRALVGESHHQHTTGDPAVEQQRQRHVAAGAALLPDHLDDHGTQHRDDDRDDRGRGAGEDAECHPGQRDVADSVTHEGQPTLDQVGADGRRREAGHDGGEQRPHDEGVLQDVHRCTGLPGDPSSGEETTGV
jgi:hypothetical protein